MRSQRVWIGLLSVAVVLAAASAGSAAIRYCHPTIEVDAGDAPDFALSQGQHAARGYGADSARVDSQITFRIPDGQAGAVYEYLKRKYVGQSGILKEQFPDIDLHGQEMSDVSIFTDEYSTRRS